MRNIFPQLLCCTALVAAGCTLPAGPMPGMPEKSPFGYKISVSGDSRGIRDGAVQQATAFCESEAKQYALNRHVFRVGVRMGSNVYTYDLYFNCIVDKGTRLAEPEKSVGKKSETVSTGQQDLRQGKAAVKAGPVEKLPAAVVKAGPKGKPTTAVVKAGPKEKPTTAVVKASPEEKLPAAAAKEQKTQIRRVASAPAPGEKVFPSKKKRGFIPGEIERLAPPGEEEPAILDGSFVEETLEE